MPHTSARKDASSSQASDTVIRVPPSHSPGSMPPGVLGSKGRSEIKNIPHSLPPDRRKEVVLSEPVLRPPATSPCGRAVQFADLMSLARFDRDGTSTTQEA